MLNNKEERYWSKYTCNYDDVQEYVVGKTVRQEIVKKINNERDLGEVIEFGCGTGYFTKVAARNAKSVIATDLSDKMLEIAETKLKEFQNITVQKADCRATSFIPGKFDTVFIAHLIHVIKNPLKTLKESFRILKSGGLLIITSYTGYGMNFFERMKLIIRYLKKFGKPERYSKGNLSPCELICLVENAGFRVEDVKLIGNETKALYLKGRKAE